MPAAMALQVQLTSVVLFLLIIKEMAIHPRALTSPNTTIFTHMCTHMREHTQT